MQMCGLKRIACKHEGKSPPRVTLGMLACPCPSTSIPRVLLTLSKTPGAGAGRAPRASPGKGWLCWDSRAPGKAVLGTEAHSGGR